MQDNVIIWYNKPPKEICMQCVHKVWERFIMSTIWKNPRIYKLLFMMFIFWHSNSIDDIITIRDMTSFTLLTHCTSHFWQCHLKDLYFSVQCTLEVLSFDRRKFLRKLMLQWFKINWFHLDNWTNLIITYSNESTFWA